MRGKPGFLEGLLEIAFPPACLACGNVLPASAHFCQVCAEEVERLPEPHCRRCAEPGDFERVCPRCELRPPPFTRAFAPFAHHGPIARAIHRFKYEDRPELAPGLARMLVEESRNFLAASPEVLCAIPLHADRFRARKYDQARLLAREAARLMGRQYPLDGLARRRATQRQVGLAESEREQNVAGAFHASEPVRGRRVLLLDDVFTTGATARAAGAAVLEAGAKEVQVLTLARAFSTV